VSAGRRLVQRLRCASPRQVALAFAIALALQLAWLARLSLVPVQIDVDSSAHAEALRAAPSLSEVVAQRAFWDVAKPLLAPAVHALRALFSLDPLAAYRLLGFAGAALQAEALRRGALALGAAPVAAALAGLLPVASFGGAFLTVTLDDNVAASALQWLAFLALVSFLGSDGRARGAAAAAGLGVLTGAAVAFHRKTLAALVLLALAPLVSARFRERRALAGLSLALALAVATLLLSSALFLPSGFSAETLARLLWSPHHENASWWFFAGATPLRAQAAALSDGWRASLVGIPLVFDLRFGASRFHAPDLLVPLALALAAASAWRVRDLPLCRLLMAGVCVEAAHSVFYEPGSVERWDGAVAGAGVWVAVAASRAPLSPWLRALAAGTWLALAAAGQVSLRLWAEIVRAGAP
jgi:hypothetical protein